LHTRKKEKAFICALPFAGLPRCLRLPLVQNSFTRKRHAVPFSIIPLIFSSTLLCLPIPIPVDSQIPFGVPTTPYWFLSHLYTLYISLLVVVLPFLPLFLPTIHFILYICCYLYIAFLSLSTTVRLSRACTGAFYLPRTLACTGTGFPTVLRCAPRAPRVRAAVLLTRAAAAAKRGDARATRLLYYTAFRALTAHCRAGERLRFSLFTLAAHFKTHRLRPAVAPRRFSPLRVHTLPLRWFFFGLWFLVPHSAARIWRRFCLNHPHWTQYTCPSTTQSDDVNGDVCGGDDGEKSVMMMCDLPSWPA